MTSASAHMETMLQAGCMHCILDL